MVAVSFSISFIMFSSVRRAVKPVMEKFRTISNTELLHDDLHWSIYFRFALIALVFSQFKI